MKLVLFRQEQKEGKGFIRGTITFNDGTIVNTLELPWKNNEDNISCIPYGIYTCKRVKSPKFGNTFEVHSVPNREHILFHSGNTERDTHGCILVGNRKGGTGLLESKLGMQIFLEKLKLVDEFELKVI